MPVFKEKREGFFLKALSQLGMNFCDDNGLLGSVFGNPAGCDRAGEKEEEQLRESKKLN